MNERKIYKYDLMERKWYEMQQELPSWITYFSIHIDEDKLYTFCPWTFTVFDLETNKWNFIKQYHFDAYDTKPKC